VNKVQRNNSKENSERGMIRKNRKKVCVFCANKQEAIDYKDVQKLRRYISDRAKILPRRVTGVCASHQRELTTAIKRARHIALIPYVSE
jgi:small subunit ribosomal protein S18